MSVEGNDRHQVEIYFGLHGGDPLLIGAGSWEDVERAHAEAKRADSEAENLGPGNHMSSGTRRFYEVMGSAGMVRPLTDVALDFSDKRADEARKAMREIFQASEEESES